MNQYIKREDALCVIREAYSNIDICPTADVVEVVRCKDCKFYDTDNDTGFPLCRRLGDIVMKPTDYCSYGEWKEQEH